MRILGIDTATPRAGVALVVDGRAAARRLAAEAERSDDLLEMIDSALAEAGLGLDDLDAVAVAAGPGSFTGLRAGIATVQGLFFDAATPAVGVPTLSAMRRTVPAEAGPAIAVLDARRDRVWADGPGIPAGIHDPAEVARRADGAVLVGPEEPVPRARSGLARLRANPGLAWAPATVLDWTAVEVARLGAEAVMRGEGGPASALRPAYLAAPEPSFRPMTPADLDRVVEIEAEAYPKPWSRRMFDEELANPLTVAVVAEIGGAIAAYALGWVIVDDLHVNNVAVAPDHQRRGIGEATLRSLFAAAAARGARKATLEVRPSNAPAMALYRRLGFREVGRRPRYYDDGEDAVLMWLDRVS